MYQSLVAFFIWVNRFFRKIQSEGLQQEYNDVTDRSVKEFTHMLLSLAYVPAEDVPRVLQILQEEAPENMLPVLDYFEEYYVVGCPRRGRRRTIPPRYPPTLWNQHTAALTNSHKTNNVSEGWHNRFRVLVGKHHPDLYSALNEIKKEQAAIKVPIAELSWGKKVQNLPKRKWTQLQERIRIITAGYDECKNDHDEIGFLRALAHNIVL